MRKLKDLIKSADATDEGSLDALATELIRRNYPRRAVDFDLPSFVAGFNVITPEMQIEVTKDDFILGMNNKRSRKLKFKHTDLRKNNIDCFSYDDGNAEDLDLNEMKTYNDVANRYCGGLGFSIRIDSETLKLKIHSLLIEDEYLTPFDDMKYIFDINCCDEDFNFLDRGVFIEFLHQTMNCEIDSAEFILHANSKTNYIERIECKTTE